MHKTSITNNNREHNRMSTPAGRAKGGEERGMLGRSGSDSISKSRVRGTFTLNNIQGGNGLETTQSRTREASAAAEQVILAGQTGRDAIHKQKFRPRHGTRREGARG